jgi:hypothetical protein
MANYKSLEYENIKGQVKAPGKRKIDPILVKKLGKKRLLRVK